jgi:HAE1 family hydrophobic/amphiphilic exporter-1
MIQVSANREHISLSRAVEQTRAKLRGVKVPIGYYYEIGGDYKKLVRSEREFIYAFIVMIALVYMVLACFFESYSQPFLMLLTLPLATAGSMPVLWVTGTAVNMGVYMGLLMLGGTVTANGIILIDRLNTMRKKGGMLRSVMKVGFERARPIFMTSLTTIAGMLPLAIKKGGSAEMWVPFALTVISGIAVSSVLSIFVIPAAYVVLEDLKKRFASNVGSASFPAVPESAGSSR